MGKEHEEDAMGNTEACEERNAQPCPQVVEVPPRMRVQSFAGEEEEKATCIYGHEVRVSPEHYDVAAAMPLRQAKQGKGLGYQGVDLPGISAGEAPSVAESGSSGIKKRR